MKKDKCPSIMVADETFTMEDFLEYYKIPIEPQKNKLSYRKVITEYLYNETKIFLEFLKSQIN
jgi:hypothetical protein